MANVAPGFFLYVRDLIADTTHMSTEEFGGYMRLLCHAWDADQCGHLENDPEFLASVSRLNPKAWARCSKAILRALKVSEDGKHVYSKRMVEVFNEQQERREQASRAGRKSAATRAQLKVNGSPTTVERPLNERSNETPATPPTESNLSDSDSVASSLPEEALSLTGARARNGTREPFDFGGTWTRVHKTSSQAAAYLLADVDRMIRDSAAAASKPVAEHGEALIRAMTGAIAWCRGQGLVPPSLSVAAFAKPEHFARCEAIVNGSLDPNEKPAPREGARSPDPPAPPRPPRIEDLRKTWKEGA